MKNISWNKKKRAAALSAGLLSALMGMTSLAATPEFARSAEEWAHLRDNALEWYEIEDLVHEYNAAVLKNREDMDKDERRSMDAAEVAEYLVDEANDLDVLADSAESAMVAATYRMQADSLRSQADSNVTDFQIIRLNYEVIEKNTFRTVQNLFLKYYSALASKTGAEANAAYLERAYNSAVNRKNVGMATELDVLTAQEALESARAALITAESDIQTSRTNLQVLCGWAYDSQAEIGPVPDTDPAVIAAIPYDTDLAAAQAASYTLRIDEIKLQNARKDYPGLVEQYEKQLADDTETFKVSFRAAYDALVNAGLAYQNAVADHALKVQDMAATDRRFQLGLISAVEYEGAKNELVQLETAERTSYIGLVSAKAAYDAAVRGIL